MNVALPEVVRQEQHLGRAATEAAHFRDDQGVSADKRRDESSQFRAPFDTGCLLDDPLPRSPPTDEWG